MPVNETQELDAKRQKILSDILADREDAEIQKRARATTSTCDKKKLRMIRRDLSDKSKKRKSSVKKNMNAYMFYAQDARDEVMADVRKEIEEGSLEKNELLRTVAKRTGVKWKSMSAEEKEKYEDMAAKDKERYIRQRIHKQFSICFVMSICVTVIDMQKKKKLKRRLKR